MKTYGKQLNKVTSTKIIHLLADKPYSYVYNF